MMLPLYVTVPSTTHCYHIASSTFVICMSLLSPCLLSVFKLSTGLIKANRPPKKIYFQIQLLYTKMSSKLSVVSLNCEQEALLSFLLQGV